MYTLLPEEQIKNLAREYHIRLFILGFFFLSGAVWIGIGSLLPSYIISVMQEQKAQEHLQQIEKTTQTPVNVGIAAEVAASNAAILRIKAAQDPVIFSSIIENIANHRIPGVTLSSIDISHAATAENPSQTRITIHGKATTRDIFVAFQRSLAVDPAFSNVTLPISNLAKGVNIEFVLTMTGNH